MPTTQPLYITWGQRIRSERVAQGLTQAALAEAVGVHFATISRVESGQLGPSDALRCSIAKALNSRVEDLFSYAPEDGEVVVNVEAIRASAAAGWARRRENGRTTLYRIYDGDSLLWVGVSVDIERRLSSHRGRDWWKAAQAIRVVLTEFDTREAAEAAEREALATESPVHNTYGTPRTDVA